MGPCSASSTTPGFTVAPSSMKIISGLTRVHALHAHVPRRSSDPPVSRRKSAAISPPFALTRSHGQVMIFTCTSRRGRPSKSRGAGDIRADPFAAGPWCCRSRVRRQGCRLADIDRVLALEGNLRDERFVGDHASVEEQTARGRHRIDRDAGILLAHQVAQIRRASGASAGTPG